MTTTSQDDQPKVPEGSEPTKEAPKASTDDKTVPLGELVKIRQEAARLREEKAALEARLAESKKTDEPKQQPDDDLSKTVQSLLRRDRLRDLQAELDLTPKQADAVAELMDSMPSLSQDEAHAIAAKRDPDTFADNGQTRGYQPGIHGSARPTPGSRPADEQGPDTEDRLAYIKKVQSSNKGQATRLLNNLVGSIAAEQMGKPGHQRIPIPKTQQ